MVRRATRGETKKRRLGPDDWVKAALRAIACGGLAAVSVEGLAVSLGATKGSFYWHFPSRDALIHAALAKWQDDETRAVLDHLASLDGGEAQMRWILNTALGDRLGASVEAALLVDTADQ